MHSILLALSALRDTSLVIDEDDLAMRNTIMLDLAFEEAAELRALCHDQPVLARRYGATAS